MAETEASSDLRGRTKQFALRVIRLVEALPSHTSSRVIGQQLLRCATSVGANYRSAKRGRSTAEYIAKMGIVEEEADEALYWLELIAESGLMVEGRLKDLMEEASAITAMVVASIKTAKQHHKAKKDQKQ